MALTKVTYSMIKGADINVLDYGADPTGLTDSTAAIQAAIDYCDTATNTPTIYMPAGTYKISDSLYVGNKSDGTRRTTIYIRGDGPRLFPVARGDNTNVTAGTMIDATTVKNRPAIVIQGVFGGLFSDFTVLGSGYQQLYDLSLSNLSSTIADWIPTGQTSGQYNAACGICIDPYSGTTPAGGGYNTGISYGRLQSSALRFDNIDVYGFVVGFGVSINNQGFNGDALRFYNCRSNCNTYCFAVCGSQNRDIQYNDCVVGSSYACWDTVTFGAKSGDLGHIKGGIIGLAFQIFNVKLEYNASSAYGLYSETIRRIGVVGTVNTAMAPGLTMRNCYFKEERETAWNDKDPLFFPQGGGFDAVDCAFLPSLPWAVLYGTSGSASTFVPPRFTNCSFVTFIQTGAPNPRPFTRWYVGEFVNLGTARPIFDGCKTDMYEGNSEFINSYSACGDTVRFSGSALPTRQVIINYSATRAITRNNTAYNLKNISTYVQTTDAVTNKSWTDRYFTFDTASPTAYVVGDYLFYGDSSLPLVVTDITSNTITSECLFGVAFYNTSSTFYDAAGFRITIVNAQFINSGAITGDITSGSNSITNVTLATTAFKVGDFIGSATGSLPTNTRITNVSGTTLTLNKNATASGTGVVIGNLICVAAA